jgi:hypothetical protein
LCRICWPVSGGAPAYSRCASSASFWHGAGPNSNRPLLGPTYHRPSPLRILKDLV